MLNRHCDFPPDLLPPMYSYRFQLLRYDLPCALDWLPRKTALQKRGVEYVPSTLPCVWRDVDWLGRLESSSILAHLLTNQFQDTTHPRRDLQYISSGASSYNISPAPGLARNDTDIPHTSPSIGANGMSSRLIEGHPNTLIHPPGPDRKVFQSGTSGQTSATCSVKLQQLRGYNGFSVLRTQPHRVTMHSV